MILRYDGTFEGFLTLVYKVYHQKYKPQLIEKPSLHPKLFDGAIEIEYDGSKSQKVLEAMRQKWSKQDIQRVMHIFLCDTKAFELDLLAYIKLGFKNAKELQNINHPSVFFINNLEKELFRHYHRYSGFLRFEELEDGTLYAKIESKFSLVYLLGRHFSKRFNNQNYIIHDIDRSLAFVKIGDSMDVREVSEFEEPLRSASEEKFQHLWQTFFDSIAIESRANEKLQKSLVPLVYRKYMREFE
ncbi:MAG: TIGR03915 family putative DNA repair protein [Sulfurimonas sp.]|jgi:probable DNA metabolism protein|nr:TIGR03915 family putative DNA repair protein [Sulfurimonas sp.]